MNAKRAARQIVSACVCGRAEVVLSLPAKIAAKLAPAFPELISDVMSVANSLLPSADKSHNTTRTGSQSSSAVSPSWITTLNERAAANNNQ
jgi:hypothetical protein